MAKRIKPFWIMERHNPQLGVYYVGRGQLSKTAAMKYENCLYGSATMHRYETEAEYTARLEELRSDGESVQ